ncbi:MAG: hypothetical protein E6J80_12735 [Deltaproteobacteria bacterium]|nr:MAG: hypothetical protein E6J80_12735 [Deltaproteobacteria bacterium]
MQITRTAPLANLTQPARSTNINVRVRIRKHLAPFFGSMRANKITTADVERFIVHRQEQGASNGEINRETALLWYGGTLAKRPDFPARWCTISGGQR